jgi:hypothetical protein
LASVSFHLSAQTSIADPFDFIGWILVFWHMPGHISPFENLLFPKPHLIQVTTSY